MSYIKLKQDNLHSITENSALPKSSFEKKKKIAKRNQSLLTLLYKLDNFTALSIFRMRNCSCHSLEHALLFIWDININACTCALGISYFLQALAGHPRLLSTVEPMHLKISAYRAQWNPLSPPDQEIQKSQHYLRVKLE